MMTDIQALKQFICVNSTTWCFPMSSRFSCLGTLSPGHMPAVVRWLPDAPLVVGLSSTICGHVLRILIKKKAETT